MIINKTTVGFVVQQFDTEKGKFISQEFVAGDDVEFDYDDYSDKDVNDTVSPQDVMDDFGDPYLPFEMVQPQQ